MDSGMKIISGTTEVCMKVRVQFSSFGIFGWSDYADRGRNKYVQEFFNGARRENPYG